MAPSTHAAIDDNRNADVLVYVNGAYLPRSEAQISIFDSGFLVGDGVWEGMRLHHGVVPFLDRHLDRIEHGLSTASIDPGLDSDEMASLILEVARRNDMHDGAHIRLMITRGDKKTPSQHPSNLVDGPNIVVVAEWKQADPSLLETGITLITSSVRRPPPDTLDQRLNIHSKMHEVIALVEAMKAGADEALMLDTTGAVATCNATNFFVVVGDQVWTSMGAFNLPGITRGVVIEVGRAAGIEVRERPFTLPAVYSADEAFVTGTFGGLTPVVTVDGRTIGDGAPGPATARLRALYQEAIEREVARG